VCANHIHFSCLSPHSSIGWFDSQSACLSPSVGGSVGQSACLSIFQSICLSAYLPVYLSVYLSKNTTL
jgi:hypothetical protein